MSTNPDRKIQRWNAYHDTPWGRLEKAMGRQFPCDLLARYFQIIAQKD